MAQPTIFSVNITHYSEEGFVRVTWTGAPSANHYSYRVYRQDPEVGTWVLVKERTDTPANFTFDDYGAPVGVVKYAVVEVTAISSVQTEEAMVSKSVTLTSPYYWLIHPTDISHNVQLRSVYTDEFATEREVDIKKLYGRGRKVDVGDDWGRAGSLSGRIHNSPTKTARQIRLDIEAAKDTVSYFNLRSPFGDNWKIWFDDPKFSRVQGVGYNEFVEISFAYYEVA